jgi:photosystem II stability/assembly factor-like uncharacterized protein
VDGGKNWRLQFQNSDRDAFFDALAYWDERNGVALSDPVKGRFSLIITDDGGASWTQLQATNLPPALPREGAFAASGTCLVTQGQQDIWFCTGGWSQTAGASPTCTTSFHCFRHSSLDTLTWMPSCPLTRTTRRDITSRAGMPWRHTCIPLTRASPSI